MNKYLLAGLFLATLAIGFGLGVLGTRDSASALGGAYSPVYGPSYLVGDVYSGSSQTLIASAGVLRGAVSSTSASINSLTIGGGTAVTKSLCVSSTWNPGSVASSGNPVILSATSTAYAVSGVVIGDTCSASLTSATSTSFDVGCNIPGNGSGTIWLYNDGAAAIDPATGTAKFCYTH